MLFELWCWRRLLRVPWTARRSNQSILKDISPGCSLEGMMLKLKLPPVLWPHHAKSWLTGKDSDAGRDWGQEKKGTTEDEMAAWHHWLDGRESEWTLGVGDGKGGLACCDSWGRKELDTTETELKSQVTGPNIPLVEANFEPHSLTPKSLPLSFACFKGHLPFLLSPKTSSFYTQKRLNANVLSEGKQT